MVQECLYDCFCTHGKGQLQQDMLDCLQMNQNWRKFFQIHVESSTEARERTVYYVTLKTIREGADTMPT